MSHSGREVARAFGGALLSWGRCSIRWSCGGWRSPSRRCSSSSSPCPRPNHGQAGSHLHRAAPRLDVARCRRRHGLAGLAGSAALVVLHAVGQRASGGSVSVGPHHRGVACPARGGVRPNEFGQRKPDYSSSSHGDQMFLMTAGAGCSMRTSRPPRSLAAHRDDRRAKALLLLLLTVVLTRALVFGRASSVRRRREASAADSWRTRGLAGRSRLPCRRSCSGPFPRTPVRPSRSFRPSSSACRRPSAQPLLDWSSNTPCVSTPPDDLSSRCRSSTTPRVPGGRSAARRCTVALIAYFRRRRAANGGAALWQVCLVVPSTPGVCAVESRRAGVPLFSSDPPPPRCGVSAVAYNSPYDGSRSSAFDDRSGPRRS